MAAQGGSNSGKGKDKPPSGGPKPRPPQPGRPPRPGYKWVWNGKAWVEQRDPSYTGPGSNPPVAQPSAPPGGGGETGTEPTTPTTGSPGAAWVWDGTKWTRPGQPSDGKPYIWDDNLGWQLDSRLMASRANAKDYMVGLFKQFGFGDADVTTLTGLIDQWVQQGLADAGTEPVLMQFRNTDVYKRRFAGMAELIGRGQAISEAEYIQLESSYRNVMKNYGLPETYYDTPSDYARLIGAGLSVNEVEQRVVAAKQAMNPLVAQELKQYYSIEDGDLTAFMLGLTDEKGLQLASARNQEQIRTQARTAQIGGYAEAAGFKMDLAASSALAGTAVGQTIDPFNVGTAANLQGTFDQARRNATREKTLASIDKEAYTEQDTLLATFGDDKKKLASEKRAARERARFGGSSGVGGTSLGVARNL